ncbi:MAG: hypothetical protein N2053_08925 [Chitinispirillaceae bacterium]|nr:hypothetical protein [Chitinispirillaceae bacterium]
MLDQFFTLIQNGRVKAFYIARVKLTSALWVSRKIGQHLIIVRSYKRNDADRVLRHLDENDELIEASLLIQNESCDDLEEDNE